jgi:outer membrane receptor for ferrienterochelin and colicin
MKYIFQINLLILCIMPGLLLAQEDRLTPQIGMEVQEAGDLVFHPDSSRLKIISTGRFSKNLDDLPLKVYVISHEEILNNQYNTLTDVLNSLPGMRVSQPGSGELGETFQVWGFTGNMYSKILVNGVPVKPSAVTGMPIGSQLPVRQADKIEVVYGNASAVYGADAVAGVINIITKESEQDLFVRGDISLGQGNYYYTNFFIGGKGGRNNNILNYSFYGSISGLNDLYVKEGYEEAYNPLNYYRYREEPLTINGVEYPPGEIDEALIIEAGSSVEEFNDENYGPGYEGTLTRPEMENLGCASHMLGLQLRFKGIGFSYNNMYRRTHSSIGLSPVFFKYNNPQNYWGEVIQRALLSYERDFRRVSSSTHLSFLSFAMDNTSSQGVTFFEKMDKLYRYSVSNDLFFEQTFSVSPAKNLEVIGGFSYKQSGALPVTNFLYTPFDRADYNLFRVEVNLDTISDRFGYNPTSYNNLSGFLQSYYRTGKFRMLGGLRYDRNSRYGQALSPHIAIMHKTSDRTSFRLSVGRAYKEPALSLAYQSLAYPSGDLIHYIAVPNEQLKPEMFSTLELGFKTTLLRRLMIDQTYFYYRITDHIIPREFATAPLGLELAANDSVRIWINNREAVSNVYGVMTTLRVNDIIASVRLNAELNLTFQDRKDEIPDVVELVTDQLSLTPKHSGKLKITMEPLKRMYVNIESHWMTKWLRILIPVEEWYDELFAETDGYYAMNVLLSYGLSDNLKVYMKVTNLFNEKYGNVNAAFLDENLIYNPQLARYIRFGLSYQLK